MKCLEFELLVSAFVDGDLTGEEAEAFRTHNYCCRACRAHRDRFVMTVALLKVEGKPVVNENESELVVRLKSGDPAGFQELIETNGTRLLATATRILGSEEEAQDAVQEALISAWKNMRSFAAQSSLSTWLHRIVVNACLERLRSSRSKQEVPLEDDRKAANLFERQQSIGLQLGPSLEKRLAMRRAIERALDQIPSEFRLVLILRDVEGMSSREAASRLGIPDATVRQRLHRARAAMAELLRPELCAGNELTCGGRPDLLFDYIDQSLADDLQEPVHDHIQSCPVCSVLREYYEEQIQLSRALEETAQLSSTNKKWFEETLAKGRLEVLQNPLD